MPRSGTWRVAMLVHNVYERDARVRRYAESLAREGHRVDVICIGSETGPRLPRLPNIQVYPLPIRRMRRERWGQPIEWIESLAMMFCSASVLDWRFRYDLIHTHNMPDLIALCGVLPRLRGCPVILDLHDPMPEFASSKLVLPEGHPIIGAHILLERLATRFASHVLTSTPYFKEILVRRGVPSQKVTVVMNAPDPEHFDSRKRKTRYATTGGRFTLLYVGTVAERYGLDTCLRAFPLLRQRIPGIRLKVIPKLMHEGATLNRLRLLGRELGIAELIEVSDPIPMECMPQAMKEADLGVYPAIRDIHMDLALSLKIPEMASMGLPIVATRLSILEQLFGEEAIAFVPSGDAAAFAEMVWHLYRSADERARLADNAVAKVAALTWGSQYQVYAKLLREILGKHGVQKS